MRPLDGAVEMRGILKVLVPVAVIAIAVVAVAAVMDWAVECYEDVDEAPS